MKTLKKQVDQLTVEISSLKDAITKPERSNSSSDRSCRDGGNEVTQKSRINEVSSNGFQFLSDEYDDLASVRQSATKQLELIDKKLQMMGARVEELATTIDAFEIYSYQYNLKIVGLPPAAELETSEVTATLCLNLFEAKESTELP